MESSIRSGVSSAMDRLNVAFKHAADFDSTQEALTVLTEVLHELEIKK
jgi:hypothetical protein